MASDIQDSKLRHNNTTYYMLQIKIIHNINKRKLRPLYPGKNKLASVPVIAEQVVSIDSLC